MKNSRSKTRLVKPRHSGWAIKPALALLLLLTSSCVSHPLSSVAALDAARNTLIEVQQSDSGLPAVDLKQAYQLLSQAERAQALDHTSEAMRQAERAQLIAKLALAKSQLNQAEMLNDELRTRIDVLMLTQQRSEEQMP